jgi:hypothetical protein
VLEPGPAHVRANYYAPLPVPSSSAGIELLLHQSLQLIECASRRERVKSALGWLWMWHHDEVSFLPMCEVGEYTGIYEMVRQHTIFMHMRIWCVCIIKYLLIDQVDTNEYIVPAVITSRSI